MKKLNKIKKIQEETGKILNNIKDEKKLSDEFSQVEEYNKEIEKHYRDHEKEYSSDDLLQMYKSLSIEKKSLSEKMNSFIWGVLSGVVVALFSELINKKFEIKTLGQGIVVGILIGISVLIIVYLVIRYIISSTKKDIKNYAFDRVHLSILESLLIKRHCCLFSERKVDIGLSQVSDDIKQLNVSQTDNKM